jgi:nucleoside-diphosphate-sugar epimerase
MIASETELDDLLTKPSDGLVEDMRFVAGDLVVLGAGGKMGPSLCRLARRAMNDAGLGERRVVAVSRWSDEKVRAQLEAWDVETLPFDLLGSPSLDGLPDASNVVYMVGSKFGTAGTEHRTWMVNAVLPALVAARYPAARIAAFSTGNVYPFVPVLGGGAREDHPLGPVGEYAMSCLGRERTLEHVTTACAILRLNYACELRYGVLTDIARSVLAGDAVDLTVGHVNLVWQGYANEVALRALRHASSPPFVLNVTGPETVSVRSLVRRIAALAGVEPRTVGDEADTALLNDAGRCHGLFGYPPVPLDTLVEWQVEWIRGGRPLWDKPTKYQVRDGAF